jgi:hypothetical protein
MRSETERKKMDNKYNDPRSEIIGARIRGEEKMKNEISNALMNAYDIKKNSYFKKIKDRILDEGISDSSEYTIEDCLNDLINSLEQLSD